MTGLYEIGQMMEGILNATNRACNDLTIKIRFCDKSINEIKGTIGGNVYCANAINDLNLGKQQMQHALELLCSMRNTVIGWAKAKGIAITPSVIFLKPDVPISQEEKGSGDSSSSNNGENNKQRIKIKLKPKPATETVPFKIKLKPKPSTRTIMNGSDDCPDSNNGENQKAETELSVAERMNRDYRPIIGGHSIEEDLENVNPNYKTNEYEWTHNCQRCCVAYEARRRGYDVRATCNEHRYFDFYNRVYKENLTTGLPIVFKDAEIKECTADSGIQAKLKVEDQVKTWDDNARGFVIVYWAKGGGHVFMVEKTNGIIRFVDPQTGNADASGYFFKKAKDKPMYCFRTDNLEFTDHVFYCCDPNFDIEYHL